MWRIQKVLKWESSMMQAGGIFIHRADKVDRNTKRESLYFKEKCVQR
jgi:hypothetical protein